MKAVFFETTPEEQQILSLLLPDLSATFTSAKLTPEQYGLVSDADILSIFIDSVVDKAAIDAMPALRLITTRSTGFDHIDTAYAASKGITVSNVPSYGSRTVAEFTFALILALSRRILEAAHQLREGSDFRIENLQGFDLYGKTLGVIGTGRIGRNVIAIAKGFGMNVIAYDLHSDASYAKEMAFKYAELPELLAQSDIITLHTPYTKDTHHILDAERIAACKPGAYIINTARGELIDTNSLVAALRNGKIAGAALDVLEEERFLKEEWKMLSEMRDIHADMRTVVQNHILIDLPQVIVTPHVAFFSGEARKEILQTTADNILLHQKGTPQNVVTPK